MIISYISLLAFLVLVGIFFVARQTLLWVSTACLFVLLSLVAYSVITPSSVQEKRKFDDLATIAKQCKNRTVAVHRSVIAHFFHVLPISKKMPTIRAYTKLQTASSARKKPEQYCIVTRPTYNTKNHFIADQKVRRAVQSGQYRGTNIGGYYFLIGRSKAGVKGHNNIIYPEQTGGSTE